MGISGKVQANEREKLKIANNGGKFELYIPGCKPRKSFFHVLATIQIFNSCFINSPDEEQFNDGSV